MVFYFNQIIYRIFDIHKKPIIDFANNFIFDLEMKMHRNRPTAEH